ncbi:hypothetical protein PARMER_03870 [Parabacteroides merdae ATCC 43184]|nr:hypothetical protein PARMER_03870 [Parabacteroides merdae ATCC 43184]
MQGNPRRHRTRKKEQTDNNSPYKTEKCRISGIYIG